MLIRRSHLPAIAQLLAFEATARLGSATAAADELGQTQSGISRNIKHLEVQINAALFQRAGRKLVLTPVGEQYANEVRRILDQLQRASAAASEHKAPEVLNLAILPAIGTHWLAPRLRRFRTIAPQIVVNLATRLAPFDFRRSGFDAAIHFGRKDWPDAEFLPLMHETLVPVCAPSLAPQAPILPSEIAELPLLHLETRPRAWARWFAAADQTTDIPHSMVFDQFSTMAEAAIHGLGVALVPDFVATEHISTGRLTRVSDIDTTSSEQYFLVWPKTHEAFPPRVAFSTWLRSELANSPPD